MFNKFYKNSLYQKIREFQSFIILLSLVSLAVFSISIYDKFKNQEKENLKNIIQNIYLQKTLKSISKNLEPRYEKIHHIVNPGESFETIIDKLNLDKKERKKILDYIAKKKIKIILFENQKLTFEIDNLKNKKVTKTIIPLNKKSRHQPLIYSIG